MGYPLGVKGTRYHRACCLGPFGAGHSRHLAGVPPLTPGPHMGGFEYQI